MKQINPTDEIKLTRDQFKRMEEVVTLICELAALSEHADDQPSAILKIIADKASSLIGEFDLEGRPV